MMERGISISLCAYGTRIDTAAESSTVDTYGEKVCLRGDISANVIAYNEGDLVGITQLHLFDPLPV